MNRLPLLPLVLATSFSLACSRAPEPAQQPAAVAPSAPSVAAAAGASAPPPGWHADHDPKHGGTLLMAGNLYHHLEGTYPEPGLFRLYVYDDFTKPIDAAGVTGSVQVKGAPAGQDVPLSYDATTQTLVARLEPAPALPMQVELSVSLTHPKTQATTPAAFSFPFTAAGGEKPVANAHPAGDHAHVAPHGGQVVTAGADHHFELVDSGGMLTLWILDAQEKTLNVDGMQATLLVQPKAGAAVTVQLMPMSVHFMANSPLPRGESGTAVATVIIGGTTRMARFKLGSAS